MTATVRRSSDSSGNPAFSDRVTSEYLAGPVAQLPTMTRGGVAIKTLVNLAVLIAAGAWGWASATDPVGVDAGGGYANATVTIPGGFWLASFGAFFVGLLCSFNPRRAAILGIIYAALQGYCMGAISAMFDAQTEGIVGAAIVSTVGVFVVSWLVYALGIIKPTQKLAFGVAAALGGRKP